LHYPGDSRLLLHPAQRNMNSGRQPEPLTLGGRLWMGDSLELGEAASVTIELADGSRLLLGPGSHITMDRSPPMATLAWSTVAFGCSVAGWRVGSGPSK
ncbi:hypothetical protein QQ73_02740, partial [Candidatus Endoriftia persephone str. Guaymas]|nr:hypothetical protein [Candidatus Endoriftia persephone str. Guaymas]